MQIDFHHAVTYVCARLAGFAEDEAALIAHSSQFVDDATTHGAVKFDNGMMYMHIASAHKMLDYSNMDELADHHAWLPFHFLPGNDMEEAAPVSGSMTRAEFMRRCICRPNSPIAQRMVRDVTVGQDRDYGLYRLGIAMHVYADTWAHQGFVGFQDQINHARDIHADDPNHATAFAPRMREMFSEKWSEAESTLIGDVLPLGHGAVLSYPDRPYLTWSYTNGNGERIERNNPKDFAEAAGNLYQAMRRYRDYASDGDAVFTRVYELPPAFPALVETLLTNRLDDGPSRHAVWLARIGDGTFGFSDSLTYVGQGPGSWKEIALATPGQVEKDGEVIPYPAEFHGSDWRHFHDALLAHQFHVLHELLPQFGILAG